jgi:hypothetical protein
MWNNGNGYGNGQGGYGNDDEAYNRMNNAREQGGARFPFIEPGRHILCLAVLEKFQHRTDGTSVRAIFEVLQSDNPKHPVGSYAVRIFKLKKMPKFDSQASDSELLAQMCIALKGVKPGYPIGNDIKTLIEPAPVGRAAEQLARGTVVECVGVLNKKGNWTNLYWNTVDQTPEQIVQQRQRLEAKGIPQTGSQQQGTQEGQYNGAPHPSQMQQQYPAQMQQATQGPQQGYQMSQQPWSQSQGQPQPQQYAPQMPQQPVAPQQGFLQQAQPGAPAPQNGGNGGRPW